MTKQYLSEQPFHDFLDSMYFKRYLQWKWLERSVESDSYAIVNVFFKFDSCALKLCFLCYVWLNIVQCD